ncbi:MAG TPA: ATP-binding protein [Bacteroidia bacterium]|jgi:two-component system phosphate regulon sensor histidine kinase PhoR|nr:ATP-binding protein [Bacteroidia bacterium]
MKNPSLRKISLYAALSAGIIALLIVLLVPAFSGKIPDLLTAASAFAITALVSYFIIHALVRRFISKPIRDLYKAIYNIKPEENEKVNLPDFEDPMLDMQKEVSDWMKNRSNEIEDLKRLEDYRREFLGNVSHELKTPIFNIQGYVTTLLDGGLEDPSINRNYLERAEKSVERMIDIVEDLESISKLEAGQLIIERAPFDIYALVMEVYYSLEMKAKSRNIKLKFREVYKPIFVNADKDRIRAVFTNLITNSIKYGKEGGETETRFYDMDDHIRVEVADNGIGISKEHLPRLFERFYRVDKGRSRDQGGTGLGLAIVKHILEAHGQTINVRSSEGVGSTFSFTLPKVK